MIYSSSNTGLHRSFSPSVFFPLPLFHTYTYIHTRTHTHIYAYTRFTYRTRTDISPDISPRLLRTNLSLSFSLISLHRIRLKLRRLILHAREHISKVKQKDSISSPTRSSARSDYNKPNAKQNNVACVYTIARKFFPKVDKISSFFLPSFFPFFPTKNPLTIIRTRRREADYAFVAHR